MGIAAAIVMFTPVGFFAACVAGACIIVASLLLSVTDEQGLAAGDGDRIARRAGAPSGGSGLTPTTIGS